MNEIKEQIFEMFVSRFKSAGVHPPKAIFIFYEKGKKIKVGYDDIEPTEKDISFTDNFIMSSFLLAQVKKILTKQYKRVDIISTLVMLELSTKSIHLETLFNHKEPQNQTFKHKL